MSKCIFCDVADAVRRGACESCLADEAEQEECVADYEGRREESDIGAFDGRNVLDDSRFEYLYEGEE